MDAIGALDSLADFPLPFVLRVLALCEQHMSGDLRGIDETANAPMIMYRPERVMSDTFLGLSQKDAHAVYLSYQHAAAWLQEVIATFAGVDDLEIHVRVRHYAKVSSISYPYFLYTRSIDQCWLLSHFPTFLRS